VPHLVTDPRAAAAWWPARPSDPRDGLAWAAGAPGPVRFLGLPDGPALWLRDPDPDTPRLDPVAVLSGVAAGLETDPARLRQARAAHPRILVSAATGYGSPAVRDTGATEADLVAVAAALADEARRAGATPVILHCPAGDPLLAALATAGFATGITDLYPVLELPGSVMADYLAGLSRNRRGGVRREIAARGRGCAHIYLGEQAREHLGAAARLSASAYRQRGQPADDMRAVPIYSRLLDSCGEDFVLTMVCHEGTPVASAVLVVGSADLLLYSAGLAMPGARPVAGYFNAAYYLPIEFAYARGLRRILLGPTGLETKRLRGAVFTTLHSAVPAEAGGLVDLLHGTDTRLRSMLERPRG
jgi:peptidoglycan biosynthesis/recognition FemAB-like protein